MLFLHIANLLGLPNLVDGSTESFSLIISEFGNLIHQIEIRHYKTATDGALEQQVIAHQDCLPARLKVIRQQTLPDYCLELAAVYELLYYALRLLKHQTCDYGENGKQGSGVLVGQVVSHHLVDGLVAHTHASQQPQHIGPDALLVCVAEGQMVGEQGLLEDAVAFVIGNKGVNEDEQVILELLVGEVEHGLHPLLEAVPAHNLLAAQLLQHLPVGCLHRVGKGLDQHFEMRHIFAPLVIVGNGKDGDEDGVGVALLLHHGDELAEGHSQISQKLNFVNLAHSLYLLLPTAPGVADHHVEGLTRGGAVVGR
jgi:hypothetical protein